MNVIFGAPLGHASSQVCLNFVFSGDLVDPGEGLLVQIEGPNNGSGGFANLGSAPLTERMICLVGNGAALFADGHQRIDVFSSDIGSFRLVEVTARAVLP